MENTETIRHVPPAILAPTKELRRPMTPPEHKLWQRLLKRVAVSKRRGQTKIITGLANRATLMLNAGLPAQSVTLQRILGYQRVETTLKYARLYDSTVARDYERAMAGVEPLRH